MWDNVIVKEIHIEGGDKLKRIILPKNIEDIWQE